MSEWTDEGLEYYETMTAARAPLNPIPEPDSRGALHREGAPDGRLVKLARFTGVKDFATPLGSRATTQTHGTHLS